MKQVHDAFQPEVHPFNPSTIIRYDLPVTSHVILNVYNLLGQEVAHVVNEMQEAGPKSVRFDAVALSSGMYVYRLTAGTFTEARKFLLMR